MNIFFYSNKEEISKEWAAAGADVLLHTALETAVVVDLSGMNESHCKRCDRFVMVSLFIDDACKSTCLSVVNHRVP
jgi:hypothetical protein